MIVIAHVAGQGAALIDTNLLWARGVGQDDERIEGGCAGRGVNRAGRIIGPPPIVSGCNRAAQVLKVAARCGGSVPGQTAEVHGHRTSRYGTCRNTATCSSGLIASNDHLGKRGREACRGAACGIYEQTGSVLGAGAVLAILVAADNSTLINQQVCRIPDTAALERRLVPGDGAGVNLCLRGLSRSRFGKNVETAAKSRATGGLRSQIVQHLAVGH